MVARGISAGGESTRRRAVRARGNGDLTDTGYRGARVGGYFRGGESEAAAVEARSAGARVVDYVCDEVTIERRCDLVGKLRGPIVTRIPPKEGRVGVSFSPWLRTKEKNLRWSNLRCAKPVSLWISGSTICWTTSLFLG